MVRGKNYGIIIRDVFFTIDHYFFMVQIKIESGQKPQ
jgi:hypothetical protein